MPVFRRVLLFVAVLAHAIRRDVASSFARSSGAGKGLLIVALAFAALAASIVVIAAAVVGLTYEVTRRIDGDRRLSDRAHLMTATAIVTMVIVAWVGFSTGRPQAAAASRIDGPVTSASGSNPTRQATAGGPGARAADVAPESVPEPTAAATDSSTESEIVAPTPEATSVPTPAATPFPTPAPTLERSAEPSPTAVVRSDSLRLDWGGHTFTGTAGEFLWTDLFLPEIDYGVTWTGSAPRRMGCVMDAWFESDTDNTFGGRVARGLTADGGERWISGEYDDALHVRTDCKAWTLSVGAPAIAAAPRTNATGPRQARNGHSDSDMDCDDFPSRNAAQRFYRSQGGPARDPHRLDADDDGQACESRARDDHGGSGRSGRSGGSRGGGGDGAPSWWNGSSDLDCPDFATHSQAQRFYYSHGGPARDSHRLDGDDDGLACETLP